MKPGGLIHIFYTIIFTDTTIQMIDERQPLKSNQAII